MASVYAAASDASHWQNFCDVMYRYTGAPIMFFGHNVTNDNSMGIIGGGYDPDELTRYHHHFAAQNPWMEHNHLIPVGMVGVSEQTVAREELKKTEFYNDWLRHQDDVVGGVAMICHRDDSSFAALAVGFQPSRFDASLEPAIAFFNNLSPHLTRCIEMSKLLVNGNGGKHQHLEIAPQAVIFIQRSGKVSHGNQAAETLMTNNPTLSLSGQNYLTSADEKLRDFISRAVNSIHREDMAGVPTPLKMIIKEFGTCVFHAHIFPESLNLQFPVSIWSDPVVGAIVVTGSNGFSQLQDYRGLLEAFGVTGAEMRLALAMLDGRSLNDYADLNNLSRHTVRNQMRALRLKTDCRNQADFVRKMLNLTSPFSTI